MLIFGDFMREIKSEKVVKLLNVTEDFTDRINLNTNNLNYKVNIHEKGSR